MNTHNGRPFRWRLVTRDDGSVAQIREYLPQASQDEETERIERMMRDMLGTEDDECLGR